MPVALDTPTVTVRGEAVLRGEPDEAIVWLTLTALAPQPGPALADVTGRAQALATLLDELGVPARDRSTSGVSVQEELEHTPAGRRSLGHRATVSTCVRMTEPEPIGLLFTRATNELGAQVAGPRWQIAAGNPLRLRAAREAAADARARAEAFAGGAGARLGRLIRLAEPDAAAPGPRPRRTGLVPMAVAAGGPVPIEPGEHEVGAAVDATFTLELD